MAEIDKLQIEIEASSAKASRSINSLVKAFANLKNAVSETKELQSIARGLNDIASASSGDNAGATAMARSIKEIARQEAKISNISNYLRDISKIDFSNLASAGVAIGSIASATNEVKSAARTTSARNDRGLGEPQTSGYRNVSEEMAHVSSIASIAREGLIAFNSTIRDMGKSLSDVAAKGFSRVANVTGKWVKNLALLPIRPVQRLGASIKDTSNSLSRLLASVKRVVLYRAIRTFLKEISQAFREGIGNLSAYSRLMDTQLHKSLDSIVTDALYIKNAVATIAEPIINTLAPAITALTDNIVEGVNQLSEMIAMLAGKDSYTRAIRSAAQYGDEVQKLGDKASEAKKNLLGIDELNIFGSNKGLEDYASMFEEVAFDAVQFNEQKNIFTILRNAWDKYGKNVADEVKSAWSSIRDLMGDVGNSFKTVFSNAATTGLERISSIIGNTANAAKQLADRFSDAWNSAGLGTSILQRVGDIINVILGMWDRMTEATKGFAKNLDFTPLLKSVDNLLSKFKPLVEVITNGLNWAYQNVLLPLGKWTIESALPAIIDAVAAAFGILRATLEALRPAGEWLWKNFLQPIASFVGDTFIYAIQSIKNILEGLTNFLDGNTSFEEFFNKLSIGEQMLFSFGAAFAAAEIVGGITKFIGLMKTLALALETPSVKFTALTIILGSLAILIPQIADAWGDMSGWQKVAAVAGAAALALVGVAVAVGAIQSALTLGIAAVAIVAGITAIAFSLNAASKQAEDAMSRYTQVTGAKPNGNFNIPAFAAGGFPEDGLFYASRGELVGQFSNGKTAVANNEQITSGISAGVANANVGVINAINRLTETVQRKDMSVELDGLTVSRQIHRYDKQVSRESGQSLATVEVKG